MVAAGSSAGARDWPGWLHDLMPGVCCCERPWPPTWRTAAAMADAAAFRTASAGDGSAAAGVDLVHDLVNELLSLGCKVRGAELEVTVAPEDAEPVATVAALLRAAMAHGVEFGRIAVGGRGASAVGLRLFGEPVAAVRPPRVGDHVVALGGNGITLADLTAPPAGAAADLVARNSHGSVLHHPMLGRQLSACRPVRGPLAAALAAALPRGSAMHWTAPLPKAPQHRRHFGGRSPLAAMAASSCGVGMLVFAEAVHVGELVDHIGLWNEPVALVGDVRPASAGAAAAPSWAE